MTKTEYLTGHVAAFVPRRCQYEQLMEEAAEVVTAASKVIRAGSMENPTPVPMAQAIDNLRGECADMLVCMKVLGITVTEEMIERRLQRWCQRIDDEE